MILWFYERSLCWTWKVIQSSSQLQISFVTTKKAWTELIENWLFRTLGRLLLHQKLERERLGHPWFLAYIIQRVGQKPISCPCATPIYIFTWEMHNAPDPYGNSMQSTLLLNSHPIITSHSANSDKFTLLNAEEKINVNKWEISSCMLKCTDATFWLCSLPKSCL